MSTTTAPLALPTPVLRKNPHFHWVIWTLPVLALVAVGYYTRIFLANRGQ